MKASTITWIAIGAIVLLAGVFAGRLGLIETVPESPLIGSPAPDLDLPLLESAGSVPLYDGAADVTVISFWASWCEPCKAEHPDLVRAADTLGPDGVRFVAVDSQDPKGAAISFLDEYGRSGFQEVVVDEGNRASIEFGIWGLPETFFLDGDGVIVGKVTGGVDFITVVDLVDQVREGVEIGETSTGDVYQGN